MMYLGCFLVLSVQAVVGFGLLRFLGLDRDGLEGIGQGWVAGFVLTAIAGTSPLMLGLNAHWFTFVLVAWALALGAGGFSLLRRRPGKPALAMPRGAWTRLLWALAALLAAVLLLSASGDRLWQDGWSQWALKAFGLTVDGLSAFYSQGSDFSMLMGDYPLGMPVTIASAATFLRVNSWTLASFVGCWAFLMVGLTAAGALKGRVTKEAQAATALAFFASWGIGSYAIAGMVDVLVAFSVLGMVVEFERMVRGDDRAFANMALYGFLGTMAKNEGVFFAFLVGVAALVYLLIADRRRLLRAWPLLLPALPFLGWRFFLSTLSVEQSQATQLLRGSTSSGISMGTRLHYYWIATQGLMSSLVWVGVVAFAPAAFIISVVTGKRSVLLGMGLVVFMWLAISYAVLRMLMDPTFLAVTAQPRIWGDLIMSFAYLGVLGAFGIGERSSEVST